MRKLFFLIIAGIFCTELTAQVTPDTKVNIPKLKEYLRHQKQIPVQQNGIPNVNGIPKIARYSHSNTLGSIYILPQDKMPCLRSDSNLIVYNMPVHTIPNGFTNIQKGVTPFSIQPKKSVPTGQIPNAEAGNAMVFEAKP